MSESTEACSNTSAPPATSARRTPSHSTSGRTRRSARAITPPITPSLKAGSSASSSVAASRSSGSLMPAPRSSSATCHRCSSSDCSKAGYTSGSSCSSNSTPRSARRSNAGPASAAARCSAVSPRWYAGRAQLTTNLAIHASIAGDSVGRIHSGPEGLTSHRNDSPITPGPGTGTASDGVIQPAFPADAPDPQRSRSNTVTSAPRLASASATHRPTAPPPITITRTTARSPPGTGR